MLFLPFGKMKNDEILVWKWKTHLKQWTFVYNLSPVEVDCMQDVDIRLVFVRIAGSYVIR